MENLNLIEAAREHFRSVMDKNIAGILDNYTTSEELLVFVEGPRWATLGYEKVAKGWRDFVDSEIIVQQCDWAEDLQSKVVGGIGFVAGIVELKVQIKSEIKTIKFRGTFVFERDSDGRWRIIHEHFSQPALDPYGIGDWLKKEES